MKPVKNSNAVPWRKAFELTINDAILKAASEEEYGALVDKS